MHKVEVDVRHIAKLARLRIPDDEVTALEEEMGAIVAMCENLPALADAGALLDEDDTMELRQDCIVPSFPRDEILQNAPKTAEGCFLVPKTVD